MICYEQRSIVTIGLPKIFGEHETFRDYALQRPPRKTKQFGLRIFRSKIAASGSRSGFEAWPEPVPVTDFEPEENLEQRGLKIHGDYFDSIIDESAPVYLTIPNFFKSIYGHWITDIVPALFVAKALLPALNINLLHSGEVPAFALAFLEAFEFPGTCIVDVSAIAASELHQLISMTPLRDHDYFHRHLVRKSFVPPVCAIARRVQSPVASGLIYVSRRNWKTIQPNSRALSNRNDVEEVFRRAGYTIFSPEQYSVAEQIAVFRQARVVAGESGSGLHNSIFMKPDGRVICIQSGRQTHLIQASLCDLFGQTSAYVVGQQENEDWNANFTAKLADVESAIAEAGQ
jgi:capsular polysaccharide biosynthesis protein